VVLPPARAHDYAWVQICRTAPSDTPNCYRGIGVTKTQRNSETYDMVDVILAQVAIRSRDVIGEGPIWDSVEKRILWSDNEHGVVHGAKQVGPEEWQECARWELGRPIAGVIPRARGGFIVAGGPEIFLWDESGKSSPFARLDIGGTHVRVNEVKCDPQGRLWAGTRAEDLESPAGVLYRIDPSGSVRQMLKGVAISNGMDWSPDGSTMYFIDSARRSVDAFDFDPISGEITFRRPVVVPEWGDGAPDGMTVDSEGCLWVAQVGSKAVVRYEPGGAPICRVEISTPAVTSCAFGGDELQHLFITSLGRPIPDIAVKYGCRPEMIRLSGSAPDGGSLFVCRPGVVGRLPTRFAG
jgi:sugar lactone lactonase YvrE